MTFVCWNIRGMNTDIKMNQVFNLLNTSNPTILGLLENKLTVKRMDLFMSRLTKNWCYIHNNDMRSKGRILVLIDSDIWNFNEISKSTQHLTFSLSNKGGFQLVFTAIYASNIYSEREKQWNFIVSDSITIDKPWIISRDFNNVTNPKDKKGGLPIPFSHLAGINNCLLQSGLIETALLGFKFTWRRRGVATNIDKVFVNYDLLSTFPNLSTIALPCAHVISDHTPILIKLVDEQVCTKGKPFKYVNSWQGELGYFQCVQNALRSNTWGDKIHNIVHKLNAAKTCLKEWNRLKDRKSNNVDLLDKQIAEVMLTLDQNPLDDNLYDRLLQLNMHMKKEQRIHFEHIKHKSKIPWLQEGDTNSRFFFAKMAIRKHRNKIQALLNSDVEVIH